MRIKTANNDTACLISDKQVKILNKVFIERKEFRELNDSLASQVKTSDKIISTQKLMALSLNKQISLLTNISSEKDSIITNYRELCIAKDNKIKSFKWQRNGLGVISAILGILWLIK